MTAMQIADDLGLDYRFGTCEEAPVIQALEEYKKDCGYPDLVDKAIRAIKECRDAGSEKIDPNSVFAFSRSELEIQLRYRGDMVDCLLDLHTDVMRAHLVEEEVLENAESTEVLVDA